MISSTAFGAPFESGDESHKSYRFQGLKRFPTHDELSPYQSLSFEFNPLTSLKTLPCLEELHKLCLDGTKITSFYGASYQPMLSRISFINTPLSKAENLAIMASIVFGDNIRNVNGIPLTNDEINTAKTYRNSLRDYLTKGYLILKLNPVMLQNQKTGDTIFPISNSGNGKPSHTNNSLKRMKGNSMSRSYACAAPPLIKQNGSDYDIFEETRKLLAPNKLPKPKMLEIVSKNSPQNFHHHAKHKPSKKSTPRRSFSNPKKEKVKNVQETKLDLFLGEEFHTMKTLEMASLESSKIKSDPIDITHESVLELTIEDKNKNDHKIIKHTPPPKLKLERNSWSDDETIDLVLTKKEAYDLFYRKHLDEITTPAMADNFVRELMHTQKKRRNK